MIERSPYTLDAVQLENAVQALQKAAETLRPSPREERLYRVLGICVRVAVAALAGVVLGVVLPTHNYFFQLFATLCDWLGNLAAIAATVFLLLNLSIVRQAFRQRRLLKKLGIRERGYRWSRLAGALFTWVGTLSLILGAFSVMGGIGEWWTGSEDASTWGMLAFAGGTFLALGVTILAWRFVQRSREQWAIVADANRLRSTLESMQTKAGAGEAVAVPAAVLEDVARIERVQIAREQRDAVVASAGTTKHGYGVLVARDLLLQKGSLDPQQRVAVEDLIDNLSANPRPAGVESTAEGLLSVRIPEGDVELQYSVDEGARRVHIVALTTNDHG